MARPLFLPLLTLMLSACLQHAEVDPGRLGPGYVTGGGEWSSGGGISVATRAEPRGGVTVICGAWTTDQQSALSANLNDDVIEAGSIELGGRLAVHNLSFMPRLRYQPDLTGAPVACVASRLPWLDGYATVQPKVRLPRMSFILDDKMGDVVVFRPGPRAPIVP